MGSNNPVLKQYIRSIRHSLPCHGKMKRHIVSQIRSSVEDYLLENPGADLAAIQAHFGTQQEIAAGYVTYEDTSVLLQKISIRKKVLIIVAGVMAVILLMWAGTVIWAAMDAWDSTRGHTDTFVENYSQSSNIGGQLS